MSDRQTTDLGHVYFEFVQIGAQVRVCAIHEQTKTEAMVIAPVQATQLQMQQLALGKLRRLLQKHK
jgi:hypothetical protein